MIEYHAEEMLLFRNFSDLVHKGSDEALKCSRPLWLLYEFQQDIHSIQQEIPEKILI